MKKIISLLLASVMVLSMLALAGCSKGNGGGIGGIGSKKITSELDKDHTYSYEEIEWDSTLGDPMCLKCVDGKVLAFSYQWDDTKNDNTCYIVTIDMDTKQSSRIEFQTGFTLTTGGNNDDGEMHTFDETNEGSTEESSNEEEESSGVYENYYVDGAAFDAKGNLYLAICYDYSDYSDENYTSIRKEYLKSWDVQGNERWETAVYDSTTSDSDDYFYLGNYVVMQDGTVMYGNGDDGIFVVDGSNGNPKCSIDTSDIIDFGLFAGRNGKVYMTNWNEDWTQQYCHELDINTGKIGAEVAIGDKINRYDTKSDGNLTDVLLVSNGTQVYSYNFGDEEPVELMDALDSDVYLQGFTYLERPDETHILACYQSPDDWTGRIGYFTKVDPKDVTDKTAIVVAGVYIDSDVKKQVVEFNKKSDKYKVQLKDYSEYSDYEDYNAPYTKLNNDLVAGNMPDILIANNNIPFQSYVNKGLIAELDPFFDDDPDMNKEDFLYNIFQAFGVDGKCYCIAPSFTVSTLVGKTSMVGDKQGWTMDEFVEFANNLPDGCDLVNQTTQEGFLYELLYSALLTYVDYGKATCRFDDGDFAKILEVIKEKFPKEIVYEDDYDWSLYQTAFRDNKAALLDYSFSDFREFARVEQGQFGEAVTWVGYPTKEGNGAVINSYTKYAISALSPSQDGCWEFVKYFLTDEYQEKNVWSFPVKLSALEKKAEESKKRPYWEYEDGTVEEYDDEYWLGDYQVTINPLTTAEVDKIMDYLKSMDKSAGYNDAINTIINEEAQAFFEGQKSADDVCSIIQSRVSLYLSENN